MTTGRINQVSMSPQAAGTRRVSETCGGDLAHTLHTPTTTHPAHTATLRHDAKESTGDLLRSKERDSLSLFELKVSDQTRHEPPETLCMHQRHAARHAWKSRVHPASTVECLAPFNIIANQGLAAPQTLHNNHPSDQRHQRPTVFFFFCSFAAPVHR